MYCWIWFTNNLLQIFASAVHEGYWAVVFLNYHLEGNLSIVTSLKNVPKDSTYKNLS